MDVKVGSILLDRFQIEKMIGKGSFGEVFTALDMSDQTTVAIKVSYCHGRMKERHRTEAMLLENIKDSESPYKEHVVELKIWYELENCIIIVMELLSHDLWKAIKNDAYELHTMLDTYAKQMVECLQLLSELKIVHGDVKPANILIGEGGKTAKFSDFGLSYSSSLGWVPEEIQTLNYRAPEVVLGYKCGPSADIWSLGCVFLECVTKKLLFPIEEGEWELMQKIAVIVGCPSQKMIREAPLRNKFFWFHSRSQRWILKGFSPISTPKGLKKYFKFNYPAEFSKPEITILLDFVDGMLKPDPDERTKPETLLQHPFLSRTISKFPPAAEETFLEHQIGCPVF